MLILSSIGIMILPILSSILLLIGVIYSEKHRMIYMTGIAFILAIIAYRYIPSVEYDLYRHHLGVDRLKLMEFSSVLQYAISEFEIIKVFIMYVVAKLNNNDILQFMVSFLGYTMILFMIYDYTKRNNMNRWVMLLTMLYMLISLNYIHFISGLWNLLAMIIFALGIYMEYIMKKTKIISYILYVIAPFIHISMLLPIFIKILCNLIAKNKINIKSIIIISIIVVGPPLLASIFNRYINIPGITQLMKMYEGYFINGAELDSSLHKTPRMLIEAATNFIIFGYAFIFMYKKKENCMYDLSAIYFITTILLTINAGIFIRFIFLSQLIGIPLIMDYFSNVKINKIDSIVVYCIIIFVSIVGIQRIKYTSSMDFGDLFTDGLTSNIITVFRK